MARLPIILLGVLGVLSDTLLQAQFKPVDITFDTRLLKDNERQQIQPLVNDTKRFFMNTRWDEEYQDLSIPLQIQFIFEGTASKGSENTFLAQVLVSNTSDQRYFDKSLQFPYNQTGLYYDPVLFDPLASFLTFYAWLVLAAEADTYAPRGGTRFYEQARAVALRGTASDYSQGWSERIQKEHELSSNAGLRQIRFAYYYGRELFEDGLYDDALVQFRELIKGLDMVVERSARDHNTNIFLKAHAERLSQMLSLLGQKDLLQDMLELNPDNEAVYRKGLEAISK